jgi:tetratricopeptide (TPR) repeat protein
VKIWDTHGNKIGELPSGYIEFTKIVFSPHNNLLATIENADEKTKVSGWNKWGQQISEYIGDNSITNISFSPDGKSLFIQNNRDVAALWPIRDLDNLLTDACDYLQDYLSIYPEKGKELKACQSSVNKIDRVSGFLPWLSYLSSLIQVIQILNLILYFRAYIVCVPAHILHVLKKHKKELAFYDQLLKIVPTWYKVWIYRNRVLTELNSSNDIVLLYDIALKISARNHLIWKRIAGDLNTVHVCEEFNFFKPKLTIEQKSKNDINKYENVIIFLKKTLEIEPVNEWALRQLGRHQCYTHRCNDAIISLQKAVEVKPSNYWVWKSIADELSDDSRYEEAVIFWEKAVKAEPNNEKVLTSLGLCLSQLSQYQDAIIYYDKLIENNPKKYCIRIDRAQILYELGRFQEAIIDLDIATKINPKESQAWFNKALACSAINKNQEAIDSYDQVIKIAPSNYHAWLNRAENLKKLERHEESIISYETGMKIKDSGKKEDC